MRYLSLLIVLFALSLTSCRTDFEFEPSTGGLEFSKDTVYLDTVFTNIGSSTYRLKVYNRTDQDIAIPKIQLGRGVNSKYRIMVDGLTGDNGAQGKIFSNVELLAQDSLFIFVEVTADVASANPTDYLYTDKIEFRHANGDVQDVDLVTLIQDAYFIYPQRTGSPGNFLYEGINLGVDDEGETAIFAGSNLSHSDPVNGDEFHWTDDKPYVIYGYALVPDNETLVVDPGARIHFHANSGLIVAKNGVIQINGTDPPANNPDDLTNEVVFEGDRLEPEFADVPGQWGTMMILSTRPENSINHLTLKNATVGILMQNIATGTDLSVPKLTLKNSQIYNCSNVGILSRGAQLTAENLAANYCGQATVACTKGGTYDFRNCTLNNNWASSRQVALLLTDYYETTDTVYLNVPMSFTMYNSIVYSSNQVSFLIDRWDDAATTPTFDYHFKNSIIRFNNTQLSGTGYYDFTNPTGPYANSCYIATTSQVYNPKFTDTNANDLRLSEDLNLAVDNAFLTTFDLLGNTRAVSPDLGAYQFTE